MRFSLSSAPGANAHMADAQLPAYWRNAGRKDTRSGRRFPNTGKKNKAAAITTSNHGEEKSVTLKPSQAGCAQNRKTVAKANSTFHSSGTAIGNVEMMKQWKRTIPMT